MVNAMINISKKANQILNIVKAKYDLKDKSAAIEKVVFEYGEDLMDIELRPEFISKIKKLEKEAKFSKVYSSIEEMEKDLENV